MSTPVPFPDGIFRALLDRIIPEDDFPGATGAGVENYIVRQLLGDCAHEKEEISRGLFSLEAEANARTGSCFTDLTPDDQDALLRELEAGRSSINWSPTLPAAQFFTRVIDLAHEGFYADPGNGGNRDGVSWRMIGYDPHLPEKPTASPPALEPRHRRGGHLLPPSG
ncbi:MAG: gluconate 2-dehydrogenase subunit 3 family protein [Opitutaceae bacterium]